MTLPQGPFACILADPPWAFKTRDNAPDALPTSKKPRRHGDRHYMTTQTEDLMRIPVGDVAAKDCALFMWVVDSHFTQAMALGEAWGFKFNTCAFVWVKSKLGGWPHVGMGFWTRKQTEQCWLFTRGSPRRLSKGVEQIIWCPRGAHSAKPDQQYDAIERLVGGPRLELFARSARPGWSAWGNEVGVRDGRLFAERAA